MSKPTRCQGLYRRISAQSGLSLMELLVAVVIMIVVMGGIYTIWFGLQRTYSFTDDDMTAQLQAQTALSEMVESIRTARLPAPSTTSQWSNMVIVYADSENLVCWTDFDRDAQHQLELVRYRVDTATRTLYRDNYGRANAAHFHNYYALNAAHPTSTRLVGNWLNNDATNRRLFVYRDGSGTELNISAASVADPTLIRQVEIDLLIDVRTNVAPIAHELRSVVLPRNLRDY